MNTQGVNLTDTLSHLLPKEQDGRPIQVPEANRSETVFGSSYINLLLRNACPEPVLRYFSNLNAFNLSLNLQTQTNLTGLKSFVDSQYPC